MKIAIIGAGYVGLTTAAVLAKTGHEVFVLDKNAEKIEMIKKGLCPFFEPDLPELIKEGVKKGRIKPTVSYKEAVKSAEVIFICVGTPTLDTGEPDLKQVFSAAKEIAKHLKNGAVVVNKSTVPVGTTEKVKKIISASAAVNFHVASCPEFLREGSAVKNTLRPDRIVIGTDSKNARGILLKAHEKLPGERVLTDIKTAEIIKYASNAFLAAKISFINEIANLCDEVNANVDDVALGMGLDPRIGKDFLKAGIGYGGSCFPKDTRALDHMAVSNNYDFKLIKAVIEVNQMQSLKFFNRVKTALGGLKGKRIAALGLAFKNNTDDTRESAAISIINRLIKEGAEVKAYDPKAMKNAKKQIPSLVLCNNPVEASTKSDALLILTEWQEFKNLPWKQIKKQMKRPLIIDGRNLLNPEKMRGLGFSYLSVGRP